MECAASVPLSDYYADYYGNDEDVLDHPGEDDSAAMATDATFQQDPEHYWFSCLSEEETWNYLDMQVKATARDLKVEPEHVREETVEPLLTATRADQSCYALSLGW